VQLRVAGQIGAGLGQACLILGQLRLRLLLVDFVLARIDLGQKLPLRHILAFLIADRGQVAAQLRQHVDGGDRVTVPSSLKVSGMLPRVALAALTTCD
jgi:hypothetical protein